MMAVDGRLRGRRFGGVLASAILGAAVLVLAAGPAEAATVSIHDDSHVLDATRVQNAAATLPDPVAVYTTIKFADDKAAFDREAQAEVTVATGVVIAVNTQSHHLAIRTGPKSRVTQPAAAAATQAFIDSYRGSSDYTAATVAALGSMRTAIQAGPARNGPVRRTTSHGSSGVSIGGLVCLAVVAAVVIAFVLRRRRRPRPPAGYDAMGGYGPAPGYGPGNGSGYGPGYGSGYGSGYGPGYGPGYGQPGRSGVSPWVAGGVGAAAGGLLGYELGREEGRDEERADQAYDQGYDDGGYGGGGADGDFGDSSGDNSGGGGDF